MIRHLVLICSLAAAANARCQPPDTLRELNSDIWSSARTYVYQAILTDPDGHLISDEPVTIKPTGNVWQADPKQTLADFYVHFSPADSARLADLCGTEFSQKATPTPLVRQFQEGVMQTSTRLWMHPLRRNQYELTEVAPFPEARFPLYAGLRWSSRLNIMEGWGRFQGTVENTYTVVGTETRELNFASLLCYKIEATGTHSTLGSSSLSLYLNPSLGFSEMEYTFFTGHRLRLTLVEARF